MLNGLRLSPLSPAPSPAAASLSRHPGCGAQSAAAALYQCAADYPAAHHASWSRPGRLSICCAADSHLFAQRPVRRLDVQHRNARLIKHFTVITAACAFRILRVTARICRGIDAMRAGKRQRAVAGEFTYAARRALSAIKIELIPTIRLSRLITSNVFSSPQRSCA